MAWRTTPNTYDPRTKSFFYSTASAPARTTTAQEATREAYRRSPLYLASLTAEPRPGSDQPCRSGAKAPDNRDRRLSPRREPSPRRAADTETRAVHRERLQHVLRNAAPPGRGRSDELAFASAPTAPVGPRPAARTTHRRDATAHHRSPSPTIGHGADFGRENASKFYQNAIATYQRTTSTTAPPIVLKELPIQKFSGDMRTYPVFRNRFIETVGGRSDLEPRHKFQYLLQYLDGEPLRLASGYLTTDNNYFKTLDRLEDRYGDRSKLVNLLAQDLVRMKPVDPTTRDLRRFHDEALRLADEMEQAGHDVDDNVLWRQTLTSKMPQSLRNKIYENLRKDPLTAPVREILARLADYIRVLELGEVALSWNVIADGNSVRGDQPCRPDPRSTAKRAGAYATDADVTYAAYTKRRGVKRAYCGRDHWASQCNIYYSTAQRYRRARQMKYCLLCLRTGHWIGTCPKRTNEVCKQCHDGHHHRSLCSAPFPNEPRRAASLRHHPVRATTPGVPGLPKNEHGSSSQQETRDTTSVSRPGVPEPTANTVCLPSAHPSPVPVPSNSKRRRRKKSKDPRTDPQGRDGTTRPTTASVAENVKQMDANVCGGDGLLSGHSSHLKTDRRSTTAEAPWDDRTLGYGSGTMLGLPDTSWKCAPRADEEASLPDSTGHCSDADTEPSSDERDDYPWFAPSNDLLQDYSGYAISTTSPADHNAVLLECLKTTAVNVNNGLTRPAVVFFVSGSTSSYISMKLAEELRLPRLEKRFLRVNTFGTDRITTIAGFITTVVLRSPQGATLRLALTASDRIVPPVTATLVDEDEVALLQNNKCALVSTRETSDLLIGQDMMYLFNRRFGPRLPNGFHVVWSNLGPMAGSAGMIARDQKAALQNTTAVADQKRPQKQFTSFDPEDPLNLWTLDDIAPASTNLVGQEAREAASVPTNSSTEETSDTFAATVVFEKIYPVDHCSTSLRPRTPHTEPPSSGQSHQLHGTATRTTMSQNRHRSLRKTLHPLDAEPLPPTYTILSAAAAATDATHLVAKPTKLPSEPGLPNDTEEESDRRPPPVCNQCYVIPVCRTMGHQRTKRLRTRTFGFDRGHCFTALGRQPTLRTSLRKTQFRRPPSAADRRNLGMVESRKLLFVNARAINEKLPPSNAPTDPVAAASTNLVGQSTTPSAATDDFAPTNLVGRKIPEPQVAATDSNFTPPGAPRAGPLTYQSKQTRDAITTQAEDATILCHHDTLGTAHSSEAVNGDFIEPGVVLAPTNLVGPDTPSNSSIADAVTDHVAAEVPAPPPFSTNTVEQNPSVQDDQAATDADAASAHSARSDAATPSTTDAPAIAAPAASQAVPATIADVDSRFSLVAADVAMTKDMLARFMDTLPERSAPDRPPDTDSEHNA